MPLITSIIFMGSTTMLAILIPKLYPNIKKHLATDELKLAAVACLTAALIAIAYYGRTTFLLGAFMAGLI